MEVKHTGEILVLLWMVRPPIVNTLMVSKSLEPLNKPDPFPGVLLRNNSVLNSSEFFKGITFCGRFYFLRFPLLLLEIGLGKPVPFIRMKKNKLDKNYWLSIGSVFSEIRNVQNENMPLWVTNQWHHFCLAFNVDTSHISLFKVSFFIFL